MALNSASACANWRPLVRILFMSGYTYGEPVKQGVQAAAGDYLGKPFTHTMLLSRVQETLAEAA